jgi:hypothetical protein
MNIINAITGGRNSPEHLSKRQKKEHQREVSHVCAGKVFKMEWSHVPITFTEADLKLKNILTKILWLSRQYWERTQNTCWVMM